MRRTHVVLVALLLVTVRADALQQPNGTVVPTPSVYCSGGKPGGLGAVMACVCTQPNVCNIGASCPGGSTSCDPGTNGTCETTIWHSVNDNACIPSNLSGLDPVKEASTTPDTFHPSCPLTFTLLTRGTALFGNAFGWYNVTGSPPAASDLHVMLDCHAAAGAQVVLDVKSEPAYLGGDIGFFLVTPEDHTKKGSCAGGDCCATVARATTGGAGYVYYSQRQFNPDQAGADSYIHLLVYDSHLVLRKFYFAWEDIFGGSDDEFTDLVTSVEGVECSGAGAACTIAGQQGVCALGVTHCTGGMLACAPLYQPGPERCNGLDDDCNGIVDDGATCAGGDVCWNGECVPHCASSEFACASGETCDAKSGLCVDPACAGVTCPSDQICRGGKCGGACDGITCPHGTTCRLGNCLDPCAGVSCPSSQVCSQGLCVPGCNQCGGLDCGTGMTCDATTGACKDPTCPSGCPSGTYCDHGACKDACDGAVCPPGQVCKSGACWLPGLAPDGGTPAGNDDGGAGNGKSRSAGCGCAVARRTPLPVGEMLVVLLFAALVYGYGGYGRSKMRAPHSGHPYCRTSARSIGSSRPTGARYGSGPSRTHQPGSPRRAKR